MIPFLCKHTLSDHSKSSRVLSFAEVSAIVPLRGLEGKWGSATRRSDNVRNMARKRGGLLGWVIPGGLGGWRGDRWFFIVGYESGGLC